MPHYNRPVKNKIVIEPHNRGLKERLNIPRNGYVAKPRIGYVIEKLIRAGYTDVTVNSETNGYLKIIYICKKK